MRVVITGGAGFLGRVLAQKLLARGELTGTSGGAEKIDSLVLLDAVAPPGLAVAADPRVDVVAGNVADAGLLRSVVDRDDISVFHLASMVSAGCELDFDGALSSNLDGGRTVLEACRARGSRPRLVFSSTLAVFGGLKADDVASDSTKLTPETTYGTTKAICELLVNDYTRKGFLDGRSGRLPTVIIRPGRPNAAASSWVSGIFREPLNGEECVVPVGPETRVPLSGYRTVIENLVRLHEASPDALGPDRALNLPSIELTAQEMIDALRRVADRPLGTVSFRPDPLVEAIFSTWAQHASSDRATRLGLVRDGGVEEVIRAYLEEFAPPR